MSGQEQNGGAPKKERKTTPEYAPKDITDLLYWSFHMSQGSGLNLEAPTLVHARIFPALFALNPKLPAAIRQWMKVNKWDNELLTRDFNDEDWTDDSRLINDRIVEEYVRRVCQYRENQQAHVQGEEMTMDYRAESYKALQALLKAAQEHRPQRGEKALHAANLAPLIIHRDLELLEQIETPDPFSIVQGAEGDRLRRMKGYSMFCMFALSEKRAEVRSFLPSEYQELWEEMGKYVREQFGSLPETVREKLATLTQKFKETTGEEIVLGAK